MTREPDRFDKQARDLFRSLVMDEARATKMVSAALRAARSDALGEAAQIAYASREDGRCIAFAIRALIPPAAAPAAEPMRQECACGYRMLLRGEELHASDGVLHTWRKCEPPAAEARNDPCQRCGKLGGHPVDFSFDGISMSSWICPHCLAAQEKRIAELEGIVRAAISIHADTQCGAGEKCQFMQEARAAIAARAAPPEREGT